MGYYNIAEEKIFLPGHQACPGCPAALTVRYVVNILGRQTVGVVPPSCIAIISGPQPYSSMRIPLYQTTLEASAASAAGIKRALRLRGKHDVNVVCLAGDGGTYDIGLQSLSAAAERNEDIIYVCMDNEGYMNTGAQKSSSTPLYAYTTSTPAGKPTPKKNLPEIMAAHRIPYVATVTVGYLDDLVRKVEKAKHMKGMRFLLALTPCVDGWGIPDRAAVKISRLAVDCGIFPLYEIENGDRYIINRGPTGIAVSAYLQQQRRFRHLAPEQISEIQREVDEHWERLRRRSGA
jgi:pyruvate ferredoxin oxidoreductase beta subunit/2-oxoisovalerate ferredoxin oxidoreductase beta subunit